ncbi:MAG: GNAT family N-acetyltransferase [Bradyrhizobium sp.]|nr:GNAT family N-acetyltransferase [Bradyrhizobium sp.]
MHHEIRKVGKRFSLRPVVMEDASRIVSLRRHPNARKFMNQTSPRVADQEKWIEQYFQRPGDWYFMITQGADQTPVGTLGIYNHDTAAGTAEWGRWILSPGSVGAIESALLSYRVAFEDIGLEEVYCRTIADNKAVVSFHDSCGAKRTRLIRSYVELQGIPYDAVEHRVDRKCWRDMHPKLDKLAARLARINRGEASC